MCWLLCSLQTFCGDQQSPNTGWRGWHEGTAGPELAGGLSGDCKSLALPGPIAPAQGDAWKILSEFKSQLVPNLKCDLLT